MRSPASAPRRDLSLIMLTRDPVRSDATPRASMPAGAGELAALIAPDLAGAQLASRGDRRLASDRRDRC